MITHEELTDIAARAYEANLGGDDPMADAVAAVVRALKPILVEATAWGYEGGTLPDLYASNVIKAILGDGAETREGWPLVEGSDKAKSETSPASFCEWRFVRRSGSGDEIYVRQCNREKRKHPDEKQGSHCSNCSKPIKFMADASTRKDEGLSGSSVQPPTPAQVARSAATLSGRDAMVRHWHLRNNHAPRDGHIYCDGCEYEIDDLIEALNKAGYKILSRELPQETIEAAEGYFPPMVRDVYQQVWDAAK